MNHSPLVHLRLSASSSGHLVCFHHAGGSSLAFKRWPDLLRKDIGITAALLPGRERRFGIPMHSSVDEAAEEFATSIQDMLEEGFPPIVLFGHSLGGLIAFEVCRRLETHGVKPARLCISGVAPVRDDLERRYEWTDERLLDLLSEMGGTPTEVLKHRDLMQLFLPVLRGDFRLVDRYRSPCDTVIQTPLTVMAGKQDTEFKIDALDLWRQHTDSGVEIELFDGGHFYLDENAKVVIKWLETHLAQVGALAKP